MAKKTIDRKKPDDLTINELTQVSLLTQNFIVASNLVNIIKKSNFYNQNEKGESVGSFFDFFSEVPAAIYSSQGATESFNKIVEFVINQSLDDLKGKQIIEAYNYTLNFLKELDIFGFFSKATTTFTALIKG